MILLPEPDMEIEAFLASAGWVQYAQSPLAGDASTRRYIRLSRGDERAVLMIARIEDGQDTRAFARIADHLLSLGLSPPRILSADHTAGLLLIEDLGDGLFADLAEAQGEREFELYSNAVDVLLELHRHRRPAECSALDATTLLEATEVTWDWYGRRAPDHAFTEALRQHLSETRYLVDVLILRDFHAENLIWLPDRAGTKRVGLLDFQDAAGGHRAYDLVSLLEDARRDVPSNLRDAMFARYVSGADVDKEDFLRAFSLLGAQRNFRILGVFARLARRDGRPDYLRLLPRVWAHLMTDLSHPDLGDLRERLAQTLPPPTDLPLTSSAI